MERNRFIFNSQKTSHEYLDRLCGATPVLILNMLPLVFTFILEAHSMQNSQKTIRQSLFQAVLASSLDSESEP